MKQLLDALKSARKIEILVIVIMLCVLLVLTMGTAQPDHSNQSEAERRMERILSRIDGAGRVSVMLSGDENAPLGCVIASDGAKDIGVLLQLQRAAQALTGLDLKDIEIVQAG